MTDSAVDPAGELAVLRAQVLETWTIHARIQLYVLNALTPEALGALAPGLKGRTVGEQFAHIHNVRLMWLKSGAPDLLAAAGPKIEKTDSTDHALIADRLTTSASQIAHLIERGLVAGRVKGHKPHAVAFVGYLISHESYHQGDIGVRLTASGFPLDPKTAFGIWEWGVR